MYTKNLKFLNDDIKNEYKSLVNNHTKIDLIVEALPNVFKTYTKTDLGKLNVIDIVNEINMESIIYDANQFHIEISIDFLNNRLILSSCILPCRITYKDNESKNCTPLGYEYQLDNRIIFENYIERIYPKYKKEYLFNIYDNEKEYTLNLGLDDIFFNKEDFISKMLNTNNIFDSVRDVLLSLSLAIDLTKCSIKLTNTNESVVEINMGYLTNYVEYFNKEKEKNKIYLMKGEFYIEKRITEQYEEIKPLVKKLGVYNGKEKREN